MLPIASAGFHVIAPDRRGYGRTSGWDVRYDDHLDPFGTFNQVRDTLGLVSAFGYRSVAAVIGHDQGSPIAAWCSVVRPDVFRSVVMMSAPFAGPPTLPFNTADAAQAGAAADATVDRIYEALKPPTEAAPFPLEARTASECAKLPRYYVMDLDKGMAEAVADELRAYSTEYERLGSRADWKAIALCGLASTPGSCKCFLDARLTCRHFLSAARATGAFIKTREPWRKRRRRRAHECWGHI
jgi:pimeloyl-ACP methyl ester carboxylesterase